ncbi:MAG: flagellar hook basal-body protein [Cyanobacteria bacterium P01_H01_bin.74]
MLSAIIKVAAQNGNRQFESLDKISSNVANYNTTGFKAKRFEQFLTADGRIDGTIRVDTSVGDAMMTKRPMDVAIDGMGYIAVTQPDGKTVYTRDGSFELNSEGYLMTSHGDLVGNGIQLPVKRNQIQIKPTGEVLVQHNAGEKFKPVGQITLVQFANPEKLQSLGYNRLAATDESGEPKVDNQSALKQGFLERSNVNIYSQIEKILRLNASVISEIKLIKFTDQIYQQAVNLKQ